MLENIRRTKTNKKNDNKNNEDIKDKEDNMDIGENTFLKLREEKLRLKEELDQVKRYGWWPGEEDYDFHKDRDEKFNKSGEPCHHFQKFPRTEKGKLFFDSVFQIELQKVGQYHIHYKNLRIELGKNRIKQMARAFQKTVDYINKNSKES